jgi:hypothetical protein
MQFLRLIQPYLENLHAANQIYEEYLLSLAPGSRIHKITNQSYPDDREELLNYSPFIFRIPVKTPPLYRNNASDCSILSEIPKTHYYQYINSLNKQYEVFPEISAAPAGVHDATELTKTLRILQKLEPFLIQNVGDQYLEHQLSSGLYC